MSQAQEEIEWLISLNDQLHADLEDCKDQLFEILQKENDVPEQTIKEAFTTILEGIEYWIDEISSHRHFDFKEQWARNLQNNRKEKLADLGLHQRCHDITWQMKLGELPNCYFVILSMVIAKTIFGEILSHQGIFPVGLPRGHIDLVKDLQGIMASDELRRDHTQISKWRGETISAMTTAADYRSSLEKRSDEIFRKLKHDMRPWTGADALTEHSEGLRQNVIDPAISLSRMIGCAHKAYALESEKINPGPVPSHALSWTVKDIRTWRNIPSRDVVGTFHCLYPGIVRKGGVGQNDRRLVSPTLLGYRSPELEPIASRPSSPSKPRPETRRTESETADSRNPRPSRRSSPPKSISRPLSDTGSLKQKHNFLGRIGLALGIPSSQSGAQYPEAPPPNERGPSSRRGSSKLKPSSTCYGETGPSRENPGDLAGIHDHPVLPTTDHGYVAEHVQSQAAHIVDASPRDESVVYSNVRYTEERQTAAGVRTMASLDSGY
ncbi:uncharacterized protein BCR38DRAFT_430487 [Pseudomassariella vexata]|uniref:Uncharacterized protein n=1 Tax=Pseudomassariella vexata TaxID=1141098 RepID=A0A1Y2E4Y6_9PEZI|nr:uncharacterized protein BCR38DRAFT_430487 [Pseudomassariella vexata]ORY66497.1 hypothetical protein BCR38DRAFT_430487 [Pseudomassariella vexata]